MQGELFKKEESIKEKPKFDSAELYKNAVSEITPEHWDSLTEEEKLQVKRFLDI